MLNFLRHLITHGAALILGFVLGIYFLPVLMAPEAPTDAELTASSKQAIFKASFRKDLSGSDFLHWGEGEVSITPTQISFMGSIAPGPDYQLYLTHQMVETEDAFLAIKSDSVKIGAVKTFDNFILDIPKQIKPADYNALIIWCESFGQFITAASFR